MLHFSGFETTERIFEDAKFRLYRGYRLLDGQKVLIKALRVPQPTDLDQTSLKTEFEITRRLQFPMILRPISLELGQGAVVYEHFDGKPPDSSRFFKEFGLGGFLVFARQLVEALAEAHQHQVVHQNLRPLNTLFDPETRTVRLLGFARTSLHGEWVQGDDSQTLTSTLAYMSPEQTGRYNRKVGLASDLYSLGVLFYELLGGFLPFTGDDPMELVHCHLARQQRPLRALNEAVPEVLAQMVDKLLQKTPEDRYRSLFGLVSDLGKCASLYEADGQIEVFPIAADDVSHHFSIPEKLYGRSMELDQVREVFAKVCLGQSRLLVVTGPAGIGKTALARELRKTVAAEQGFFVTGLCEQTKTEIPYKPFIDTFSQLVRQILAKPPAEIDEWRVSLQTALGSMGQAIVDVVPDLEWVIGKQEELPPLGMAETRNRFRVALLKFLKVFAGKDHPLVLFLDDLQWMGPSTLELIQAFLSDSQISHFFLVGTFRCEEDHAEALLEKSLGGLAAQCDRVHLGNIDLVEIQEMLLDALGVAPLENRSLADLALIRSQGNPLHVGLYLHSLYEKGLLSYVAKLGRWNWEAALISARDAEDEGILSLIQEKTAKLSAKTLHILQLASCIGTRFSLRMLAVANQTNQFDVALQLIEAIEAGLIVPLGDGYLLTEISDASDLAAMTHNHIDITYEFLHNQVQQSIYESMASLTTKKTHLRVGKLFLAYSNAKNADDQVFDIVNQLNLGRELMADGDERLTLARLNYEAGLKARDAAAYQDASKYLLIASGLLPELLSAADYPLFFDTHLLLAEMKYFSDKVSEAETLFDFLLARAGSRQDQALVHEKRVTIFINVSRLEDAVQAGQQGLALYGLHLPKDEPELKAQINLHRQRVEDWLQRHSNAEILALPKAINEEHEHIVNLLMHMTPAAFNTNQDLFRLITLLQVEQVIRYGHSRLSAYACASLGILLGMQGDYNRGFELAQLALEVNARFPDPLVRNRLLFIGCNLVNHWRQSVRMDLATLTRIFRYAEQHGDLVYANYAQLVLSHHRWFLGESLLKILDEVQQHLTFAIHTRNEAARWTHSFLAQAALNLRGQTLAANSLNGTHFQASACLEQLSDSSYYTGLSICRIIQVEILYLRGFYEEAWVALEQSTALLHYSDNLVMLTLHYFYQALLLGIRGGASAESVGKLDLKQLIELEARFARWAALSPDNFETLYQAICGERARLEGKDLEAMRHYQRAIRHSKALSQPKWEALVHELAFRFFIDRSFYAYATHHLTAAIGAYSAWGATAKVEDLRRDYAPYLTPTPLLGASEKPSLADTERLDKITLLKAAQAISGEIEVDRLLAKMMRFVVENAGAQRGLFISNDEGRLMISAEWHVDHREVDFAEDLSINSREDLCKPVVYYVQRTRSDLVIDDVAKNETFVGDPYLQHSGVQTILCMPVLRQTELLGILYLENHLARGTFTIERMEMLRLLTPQMAVSLENAHFIANMAELNTNLTREIQERQKAEQNLRKAKEIAVANAHNAGKAEFASSVLHNINNVLNTVGLAAESMTEWVALSKIKNFNKVMDMVCEHKDDLHTYFSEDPRGKLVPGYLTDLSGILKEEHGLLEGELDVLRNHIRLMKDIIETQQRHAKGVLAMETVDLVLLCEDVLHIQKHALERHNVTVIRNFQTEEPVHANKANLTHIVINLVKNAVEAMGFQAERVLTLLTRKGDDGDIILEIRDTGVGITEEAKSLMFSHGFTTKADGHGFGLHYCRKAMAEMKGGIEVYSDGGGLGARFVLSFATD